ncbi:MAG: hypothetical protein IKK34_12785 [Clostridia bacterium]|nr:hypothetical protein [Clostridia bacterium]
MTTKKIAGYSYDPITNSLTMTAAFAKKASQLNTAEYNIVRQLRNDNPGMKIEKSAAKAPSNRPLNITFAKMEEFIKQCRDSKDRLEAFKKVKALSKIQASPYKYVKTWFLNNYANYSEQPEFDADGFVVVKTKSQMEVEKKTVAESQEQSFEEVLAEAKAQFEATAA